MKQFNKTTIVLIFLLVASNLVWGILYESGRTQLTRARDELAGIVQNKKIVAFQKMFIEKVLMTDGVVDFNTRVDLQNAVTAINDPDISTAWNAFLAATSEADGQNRVKVLLLLLATKAYSG